MGLAENLPVYKESYHLFTLIIKYSRNIPRDLKLLLGSELKNNAINLILSIYKANIFKEQRTDHIENCLLYLKYISLEMQYFVENRLHLTFHKNKNIIGLCSHGVDFVGRKIYPYHTVIRKSTLTSLYKILNNYQNFEYDYLIRSINSYFGMLRKTNSFNIRKNIAVNYPKLIFDKNYIKLIDVLQ